MTVQAQNSTQYYSGPISIGTVLAIKDFTFIDNSHVAVKVRNEATPWIYGVDYTVAGANTLERTITVLKEVPEGKVLAAYLEVPITQNIAPEEGGSFPAATQEFTIDKLTYICQMLKERLSRALQVSVDSLFDGTLPEALPNRTFKINPEGTGLVLSKYDPDTALVNTEAFKNAAEAAALAAEISETNAKASETTATQSAASALVSQNAAEQAKIDTQAIADQALIDISSAKTDAVNTIDIEEANALANIADSIQEAKDWAIKMDGKVNNEDYSAKYYANEAKAFGALNKTQITNCILEAPNGVATYSGNTITIKQNLKVLLSNGRNADNTLNNIEYSVTQEYSKSVSVTDRTAIVLIDGSEGSLHVPMQQNVSQGKKADMPLPSQITNAQSFYYATDENKWYIKDTDGDTWEETQTIAIATCVISDGTITSLTPYQPVELLKRTDKEEILTWGAPSDEYINISPKFTADGVMQVSDHVAPANGYVFFYCSAGVDNGLVSLINITAGNISVDNRVIGAGYASALLIPVAKNDKYRFAKQSTSGVAYTTRFIYAKGAI